MKETEQRKQGVPSVAGQQPFHNCSSVDVEQIQHRYGELVDKKFTQRLSKQEQKEF